MDDMYCMGNLNFAFPATLPISTTTPDAMLSNSSTLGSCFNSSASTTAVTGALDESFLLSPPGLATDVSLEATTSADVSQPYLGLLSPSESENIDSPFTPFLATERSDNNKMLSDASAANSIFNDALATDFNVDYEFNFGSSSSSLVSSPGALVTADLFGYSATTHQTPSPEPPAKKPKSLNRPGNNKTTTDSRCTCLTQALGLMKQLFPHPPSFCTTSGTSGDDNHTPLLPSNVPGILERNRHTVQTVSAMLACPCSQDVHLLSVLAHIVFKVLEWYEVACARSTPLTPPATPTTPRRPASSKRRDHSRNRSYLEEVCQQLEHVDRYSSSVNGGDSAAQMVLRELHHVQKLVNELAAKLKTQSGIEQPAGKMLEGEGQQLLMPFSGAILDLLGVDLRKRVKEVVGGVVRAG